MQSKAFLSRHIASQLLIVPTVLFLLAFLAWPLMRMASLAFEGADGSFSLENLIEAVSSPTILGVSLTTIVMALLTAGFSVLISYPVALYLSRNRGKTFAVLMILILIPFWVSVLIRTLAWFVLLGRNGVLNSAILGLGLSETPLGLLYSWGAVLVSMVHAIVPIAVLTILSSMQNIDTRLTTAASTLGATPAAQFWQVYFPLTWPGVATAFVISFVLGLGFFVQPSLLGSPDQTMIGQLIIQQIDELFNWNMAAAIAIVFLSFIGLVILFASKVLGVSVAGNIRPLSTGKGVGKTVRAQRAGGQAILSGLTKATGWIFPDRSTSIAGSSSVAHKAITYTVLIWLSLPVLFLIPLSFTQSGFFSWPPRGFSLQWYQEYFGSSIWVEATVRSIIVGLFTAGCSILIGMPAAIAFSRGQVIAKPAIMGLILLSLAVPNILIALAMFYFFADLGLVGTDLGLVLGQTVFALPYVIVAMIAAFNNYDWRLNTAAHTLGANPLKTYWFISVPLLRMGIIAAFIFAFIRSFDELTVALFIASGTSTTLPKRIWSEAHFNITPTLAAVSTVVLVGVIVVVAVTEVLSRRGQANTKQREV